MQGLAAAATLAGLSQASLHAALPDAPPGLSMRIAQAAARLATGDLDHAAALAPEVARPVLARAYAEAFRSLLHVLAAVTLISAVAVFGFLGRASSRGGVRAIDGSRVDDGATSAGQAMR